MAYSMWVKFAGVLLLLIVGVILVRQGNSSRTDLPDFHKAGGSEGVRASLKRNLVGDAGGAGAKTLQEVISMSESESEGDSMDAQESIANSVFDQLTQAAASGNKAFLDELAQVDPKCSWCNQFYQHTREQLRNSDLDSNSKAYLSKALAQSGSPGNLSYLADTMKAAGNQPELGGPAVYGRALEEASLPTEVVDQIGEALDSQNPYLRDAALSVLTKQGTLSSLTRLYEYTVEQENTDGFYRESMGLGRTVPQPEAFSYLEQLVNQRDQYSHLAVKALLNYGREGLDRVVALLDKSDDTPGNLRLLKEAVGHVDRDPATLSYLRTLSQTGQPAIRQLAQNVLSEYDIDRSSRHLQVQYNENFEQGLIRPTPDGN